MFLPSTRIATALRCRKARFSPYTECMQRGKTFTVNPMGLDKAFTSIRMQQGRVDKMMLRRMTDATKVVYKLASARRPMISKTQMKAEGRNKRVSDPNAQAGVPVQTGALQASIKFDVSQKRGKTVGKVWTDSPYAAFVEWGTSRMAARPFMRPAMNLAGERIKKIFNKPAEKNA